MAKAQKDFRWSDVSFASWQWEQLMSCFFSASQFDRAHHFSLGFSKRDTFFGSVLFLLLCFVAGFHYSLAFVFFLYLKFCLFIKTPKNVV